MQQSLFIYLLHDGKVIFTWQKYEKQMNPHLSFAETSQGDILKLLPKSFLRRTSLLPRSYLGLVYIQEQGKTEVGAR